jgi:hypothetical protein
MRFQKITKTAVEADLEFIRTNTELLWGDDNPAGNIDAMVTDDGRLCFVAIVPNYGDNWIYGLPQEALDKPWNRKVLRLFLAKGWELLDEPVSFGEALAKAVREGRF